MSNAWAASGILVIVLGGCKSGGVSGPIARNVPSLLLVPYYATVGDVWSSKRISVYKVDSATGSLTLVKASPFAAGSEPTDAALAPGGFAYVANKQSGNVSAYKIDAQTAALAQVPGSPYALADFYSEPTRIVVDPPGMHAYAVSHAGISAFSIDAATGALAPVPGSPFATDGGDGVGTASIAIEPSDRLAFVLNSFRNTLSSYTIDAAGALKLAGAPLKTDDPSSVTVNPNGKFAYVTGSCCIDVYAIDARTGALTPSAHLSLLVRGLDALGGFAIEPTGKFAYAVVHKYADAQSRVYAYGIDATTGALRVLDRGERSPGAGSDPYRLTIDPTGAFAYVFDRGSPGAAITIYGYKIDAAGGQLTPLPRSPFTAAASTTDPIARWFNSSRCAAFASVTESGAHSPPVAKRDSDLVFDRTAVATPGYFYDPKRHFALHYPTGDAGGTITLQHDGEPPPGVPRRDLSGLQTASGIKLGSQAESVVRALGAPKIVSACNEQGYFYVSAGGEPLLLEFTIKNGIVTGISEERGG